MKRRVLALGLAFLASLTLFATSVIRAGHSWGDFHWARTANPFTLKLGNNLSGSWEAHLDQAMADWDMPTGGHPDVLDFEKVAGGTKPKPCKGTDGRIEVCNAEYGFKGWLGVAQIWASGDHITRAVAKVNDTYFNFAPYNDPNWRQLVMCQEIAHGFGLHHQDEDFDNGNKGTCMDYTSNPLGPPDNTAPNVHDFEELAAIYDSHTDLFNTYDDGSGGDGGGGGPGGGPPDGPPGMGGGMGGGPVTPPGLDDLDLSQPGQWGRMIASSADGRRAIFELDFGNGIRVRTFVIWA